MELILQEISTERYIEIPEEVREIYKLYRPTPLIRARRLEKAARHPGPHLLQERRRLAGRQPQAQHRHPAGFLQQSRRDEGPDHRDRRRSVGHGPGDGLQFLRHRPGSLHGQGLLQPETLPPHLHGDLRRAGLCQPDRPHRLRPLPARRGPGQQRLAGHRHLRGGGSGGHLRRGEEIQPGLGAQPCADAPDRHRRGGPQADGPGRRIPGCGDRLCGRRLELRRDRLSLPAPEPARTGSAPAWWPSSRPPPPP